MAASRVESLPGGAARRSAGEIVQDILVNFQEIVRSELQIARAELAARGRRAGKAARILAAGLLLLLFAAACFVVTAVAALAIVMPVWLAALLVAVLLAMVGGGMAAAGRQRLKQTSLKPERAIQGVKEDVTWLKRQTS